MKLRDLLADTDDVAVTGDPDTDIAGLSIDTRTLEPGDVFVALRGGQLEDRHEFLDDAVQAGASAVVVEDAIDLPVATVRVASTRRSLPAMAARFYDAPARSLRMVGVTGTNGKTTTTYLIRAILEAHGLSTGLVGTVEYQIGNRYVASANTTPEAHRLQSLLRQMVDAGNEAAVLEVSSHGLGLHRVDGIRFEQAVFTNLTRDHLDFHETYEQYSAAKASLFDNLDPEANAIVNTDDDASVRMVAKCRGKIVSYGIDETDVRILGGETHFRGSTMDLETPAGPMRLSLALAGAFNQYNAAAAVAVGLAMDVPAETIVEAVREVTVPGRFEPVDEGQSFGVFVDYAHTPDSLENVLSTGRALTKGRLISVFGCGGDRDPGKRPEMGKVSSRIADLTVVTSDNPRTEDPEAIVKDILPGVGDATHVVEIDRKRSIEKAVGIAEAGDLVVIAGKGHEDYQIIGRETIPFDDRTVAREAIRNLL